MQEESLSTVRSQIESSNLVLKEKQNEVLSLDRKSNRLSENISEYELKADQLRQKCKTYE